MIVAVIWEGQQWWSTLFGVFANEEALRSKWAENFSNQPTILIAKVREGLESPKIVDLEGGGDWRVLDWLQ